LPFHLFELFAIAETCRHPPPYDVRFLQIKPRIEVRHLDHIFLVHHYAIGLGHDLQQCGRGLLPPLRIVVAQQVFAHHAALRNTRTNDAARGHQAEVIIHAQFLQQHAHRRAFHIEATDRVAYAKQILDRRVLFETRNVVYVDRPAAAFHQLHRIAYVAQAALAEQIEFVQAQVLRFQHAELRHRKSFRRTVQRGVAGDRLLAHEHAAGMYAEVVRHSDQVPAVTDHRLRHLVHFRTNGRHTATSAIMAAVAFAQRIDLRRRQTHGLAQFADRAAPLEGGVRRDLRHMVVAAFSFIVFAEDVAVDLVAVLPAEVDVEVGRFLARRAYEAFEIQIELDRVHIGNAQAV